VIRTPLRKFSNSSVSKTKLRIQKLLTANVRVRDGGCIMRSYPETGRCSGYTAADHIISRVYSATYGDLRNVICLCQRHHIYWKPSNPVLYWEVVKRYIGDARARWIETAMKDRRTYSFTLWDWQKVEAALKNDLAEWAKP
jgi:hypothetical protein